MINIIIIIILSIIINFGFSQDLKDIRIVKILDTNLFETRDSILIKLADIQSPGLFSKDSVIAKRIIKYATENFFRKPLSFQPANGEEIEDTLSVYLYREYNFETICYWRD